MAASKVPQRFTPFTLGQTTMANAQSVAIASDQSAVPITGSQSALQTGSWTSATALNTAVTVPTTNLNTVSIGIVTTSTFTGGIVTFEVSPDGTNFFPISVARIDSYTVENTYTLIATTSRAWSTSVDGFTSFRVRLSTVIAGTGTATVLVIAQLFAIEPIVTIGQSDATKLLTTVTPPTVTKATQGATGFTVQSIKDAGRSSRNIFLDSFAVAATAETIMTMSYSADNATVTTGTSYNVTAAKRLRLQSITASLHTITGNTTAVNVIVRIRVNNGGAGLVTSPIQLVIPIQGIAAANQAGLPVTISFPDGWEFVAGAGLAVTVACSGFVTTTAAPKVDITIVGYEY